MSLDFIVSAVSYQVVRSRRQPSSSTVTFSTAPEMMKNGLLQASCSMQNEVAAEGKAVADWSAIMTTVVDDEQRSR